MSNDVTILPDGSAFSLVSLPLPSDHWLYAPLAKWDSVRDESSECPLPILTNEQREAVKAAARYAIRGATMRGQEMDFDPDALVLNFAYALCGPANGRVQQPGVKRKDIEGAQQMNDQEINRKLSSIWWRYVRVRFGSDDVGVAIKLEGPFRKFDYRDWRVIGPIAQRYDCFPFNGGGGWCAYVGHASRAVYIDTPQKAIALAVIAAHEAGVLE